MSEQKLSREEVLKIAKLARLELKEDEIDLYQERLGRVLGYVEELSLLKTNNELRVTHIPNDSIGMREDKAEAFENIEGILSNAPDAEDHCFKVPPVLEES